MDFINNLIKLGGTPTVLCGAFIICLLGYAIGSIKVKGVELGTAGVFLMALLFGYLFTLPGLKDIPVLGSFYIESAKSSAVTSYKFIESIGLVLFVTGVGSIAGPNFFRDLKKNAKSYVPLGAVIILIGAAVAVVFALIPGIGADFSNGILSGALTSPPPSPPQSRWLRRKVLWLSVTPWHIPSALSALCSSCRSYPRSSTRTWRRNARRS